MHPEFYEDQGLVPENPAPSILSIQIVQIRIEPW